MRPPRIVCTVAPQDWFGGRDYLGGKVMIDALASLGYELFLLETECFFLQDGPRIEQSLQRLREFAPDVAISTPNAGYGLGVQVDVAGRMCNVFTDVLRIPLALCWDDPMGQFANQFLTPLPATAGESQSGALQRLREGVSHPLIFHYGWDTGHINTMVDLGLLARGEVNFDMLPAKAAYLDYGEAHGLSASFDQTVCFVGNVYLNQITADPLHQVPEIAQLVERITERRLAGFAHSAWDLFIDEIQRMPDEDLVRLRLWPDETFFWQAYRYVVWVAVNTRVRMGILSALQHPVDFYGGFADPDGVSRLQESANIRYRGSVDYITELPRVFNRSRITVDVTNQLAQNSVPGKFFECFAAGGFMLIDRRPDLIATFGDAAECIAYSSVDELNAKIEYFLTHESDRQDLIHYFQERMRQEHSPQAYASRMVTDLQQRAESRRQDTLPQPVVTGTVAGAERLAPSEHTFLGGAIWRQRHALAESRPHTRALHDALRRYMPPGHPGDLPFYEWGQLIACALEFAPDLILEVGRGYGNSTLAFTQAANLLKPLECRVVSVCLHPWQETYAAVSPAATPEWFSPLTVLHGDVREFDCEAALRGAKRVLVFWDAHGYDVAECILGKLMPVLADCDHLVLMHDIGDARYQDADSYGGHGIWKGECVWPGPMIRLGNVLATVQQAVAIVDFASRNRITLHSAMHSLHSRYDVATDETRELRDLLGDFFEIHSGVSWYTLNEAAGPYYFPRCPSTVHLSEA